MVAYGILDDNFKDGLTENEAIKIAAKAVAAAMKWSEEERRKVIALRMGASMTLYYQWFLRGEPVGPRLAIPLHDGDMYVMSEKAVGTDWKKKVIYTLRHATGADKFCSM